MTIALVASTIKGCPGSIVSTDPIDTTGANLLVFSVTWYQPQTTGPTLVSDNKGNLTWVNLTQYSATYAARLVYCLNPASVGPGHTFTVNGGGVNVLMGVMAFSGVGLGTILQNGFSGAAGSPVQPGSVTPSKDGSLLITNICTHGNTHTINFGFTATTLNYSGSTYLAGGFAYLIQGAAAAINPTWSYSPLSNNNASAIAVFKPAGAPVSGYPAAVLATAGLVSYWKLDETSGTNVADEFGPNTGSYNGGYTLGVTSPASSMGTAVTFNGSTGYVTVPNHVSLHPTAAVSLELWFKLASTGSAWRAIAGTHYSSNATPFINYALYIDNLNQINWLISTTADTVMRAVAYTVVPALNTWYHLVGTYDGTTMKLYVNGVLVGSLSIAGIIRDSGTTFEIARYLRAGSGGEYLPGTIDEVSLYNTALSAATVTAHYNAAVSTGLEKARISQVGGLAVIEGTPRGRVSQAGALAVTTGTPRGRISQAGALAVYPMLAPAPGTRILLRRSSTAGAIPAAASLQVGELALNVSDSELYAKMANNTVARIGGLGANTPGVAHLVGAETIAGDKTFTGLTTVQIATAGTKGLVIKGAVSQSANLQEFQNSAGTALASVNAKGSLKINGQAGEYAIEVFNAAGTVSLLRVANTTGEVVTSGEFQTYTGFRVGAFGGYAGVQSGQRFTFESGGASILARPASAGQTVLGVRGAVSQTANLQEWQNDAGTILAGVGPDGTITAPGFVVGTMRGPVTLFSKTNVTTAANTLAYIDLVAPGIGSLTLPANFWYVGRTLRYRVSGRYQSAASAPGTLTFTMFSGGTTLGIGTVALPVSANWYLWTLDFELCCKSVGVSGLLAGRGAANLYTVVSGSSVLLPVPLEAPWSGGPLFPTDAVSVDTTVSTSLPITCNFSVANANNSIATTHAVVQALN